MRVALQVLHMLHSRASIYDAMPIDVLMDESARGKCQRFRLSPARPPALARPLTLAPSRAPAPLPLMARRLGLRPEAGEVRAEVLPADKVSVVREWQAVAGPVAMVGDGVNDAPALAAADVGMAMGSGTDVAMHAAGITLLRGDPALVPAALDISARTVRKIRQNLFWAFIYNVAGIPLAALGWLDPVLAGAAMAASSVSVVSNALWLTRWRPAPLPPAAPH